MSDKPEADPKPQKPFTAYEARVDAFQQKQNELDQRALQIGLDYGPKLDSMLATVHLIDDEKTRAATVKHIAKALAKENTNPDRVSPDRLSRIAERSLGNAVHELTTAARSADSSDDRDRSDASQESKAKDRDNTGTHEMPDSAAVPNGNNGEHTDAQRERIAKIREHGRPPGMYDELRSTPPGRNGGGNSR